MGTHGDPIQTHFHNIRTLFGTWAKVLNLDGFKIKGQILKILLVWPTVPTADLGSPKSSTWTATTHPSIKEAALRAASTKGGGRLRRPPPFVDSFMDGFVEAKEAAGAAQTHVNLGKTCTCMHILRATSDPRGHHGHAQSAGWPNKVFFGVVTTSKEARSVHTICFPVVSRRDLCYASENEAFCFAISGPYSDLT